MGFDQGLRYRQAEARAALLGHARVRRLLEGHKDLFDIALRDADAVILDGNGMAARAVFAVPSFGIAGL
jgi:hypothetical protein